MRRMFRALANSFRVIVFDKRGQGLCDSFEGVSALVESSGEKVSELSVHIGARVMALAGLGEVLVSSTLRELVAGSGINFEEHGVHALKGVPGKWLVSRALAARSTVTPAAIRGTFS